MKPSMILSAFAFTSLSVSSPVEHKRQTTPVTVIASDLSALQGVVTNAVTAISTAVATVRNNVGASAAVAATINANLQAIATGLQLATSEIASVTTGAAGGVATSAQGLTLAEIGQLASDIQTAQYIVSNITTALVTTVAGLPPATAALVQSEITTLQGLLVPFIVPLNTFGMAAMNAAIGAQTFIAALMTALNGLNGILASVVASVGLSSIGL